MLRDPQAQDRAWEEVEMELRSLDANKVERASLDGGPVAQMVFAHLEQIQALNDEIMRCLPHHPIQYHIRLGSYTLAFLRASERWKLATQDQELFQSQLKEAIEQRKMLLSWAQTAVLWNVFKQSEVDAIRGGQGHTDIATDLITLGRLSLARWTQLEGKVGYTKEQAERAVIVGQELLKSLGEKNDLKAASVRQALDDLNRSFTLLKIAYRHVQDAVTYVRREYGDAEQIAPSLFRARRTSKKSKKPVVEEKPAAAPDNKSGTTPA